MQGLHAHTRRVAQEANTSVLQAKQQVTEEQVKLHAQNLVAESLSNLVMLLTGERDAANATVTQQKEAISHLNNELEVRKSVDEIRYEHECQINDVHVRYKDKRQKMIGKWRKTKEIDDCHASFLIWRVKTQEQRYAALRDTLRTRCVCTCSLSHPSDLFISVENPMALCANF